MTPESGASSATGLFTLLYVSEFSGNDATDVLRICRQSRQNNERDGITGLLVFDGHAFCQFVEGPRGSVLGLHDRLASDPRHAGMRTLHVGPAAGSARRFPSWRLGYAFVADPRAITQLSGIAGESAVDALAELVPKLAGDDSQ